MRVNGSSILKICFVLCLLAALLCGCEEIVMPTEPTVIPSYTVQFLVDGKVHREQTVKRGECPTAVTTSLQGIKVLGWQDETGTIVDPTTVAVNGDVTYKLAFYPALDRHAPYLFTNDHDQLRPDDVLTEKELKQALKAVASGGAKAYFPELPEGEGGVDGEFLGKILLHFFPKERIEEVVAGKESVTRSAFAQIMNNLLQRDAEKSVILADDAQIPVDVTSDREDAAQLLEAALSHTESADGITWNEVELPTTLEPGFVNLEGYLYYITEDGYYLKDGKVGTLFFGENGRYTSGDLELDDLVAERLWKIMNDHPDATGEDLLYQVYLYCRDSFKYISRGILEPGATGWEVSWAKQMLQTKAGNCYSYNATFWALARGLGYDAYCYSGYTAKDYQPHGWCQIDFDGKPYIFDPQLGMRYIQNGKNHNMFKLPYERAVRWPYHWPENAKK